MPGFFMVFMPEEDVKKEKQEIKELWQDIEDKKEEKAKHNSKASHLHHENGPPRKKEEEE